MNKQLINPLLPGFYPDPSVCRKGEDYYLVTSTFEYFPGIPIFHSRDFVHWHQLGHVLARPEQLPLDGVGSSRGIYASSIFYHEERDRFYVITTLVRNGNYHENVNFYVHAEHPDGPWSDPVIVKGAEGIDPSLVFEGQKTYYLGNCRPFPGQPEKGRHIWLQEMDLETGELTGERHVLLKQGAFVHAAAPEGPHIYHIGDWYYLLIAEGGTFRNHAATVFRSRCLTGPYESDPRNPLITHRNLRRDYPINNPGHADMIQLHNGEWWAVLLAVRPVGGRFDCLGRETFAVPVLWEEEWPVFSPDTGRVEFSYPAPELEEHIWEKEPERDDFDTSRLSHAWISIRTSGYKSFSLTERLGFLRLFAGSGVITEEGSPSFLGRRQQHMCFEFSTSMEFEPKQEGETCGIVLLMNHRYHLRMEYGIFKGRKEIRLTRCVHGQEEVAARRPWENTRIYLKVEARYQKLDFFYSEDGKAFCQMAKEVDGTFLSREAAGGYTGTILGLYASAGKNESSNYGDFDWFEYKEIKDKG